MKLIREDEPFEVDIDPIDLASENQVVADLRKVVVGQKFRIVLDERVINLAVTSIDPRE